MGHYICVSTHRYALVNLVPDVYQSEYRFNVSVFDYHFHIVPARRSMTQVANFNTKTEKQYERLLACFGLEWLETDSYDGAVDLLELSFTSKAVSCHV